MNDNNYIYVSQMKILFVHTKMYSKEGKTNCTLKIIVKTWIETITLRMNNFKWHNHDKVFFISQSSNYFH